jgi:hypothetical protein
MYEGNQHLRRQSIYCMKANGGKEGMKQQRSPEYIRQMRAKVRKRSLMQTKQ